MLVLEADPTTASVVIKASIPGAVTLQITRHDGRVTEAVRWANPWVGESVLGARDFEAPFGLDLTYTLIGYDADHNAIATETAKTVLTGVKDDWLRPVTRPLAGMPIWVESYPTLRREGKTATFDVLNRADRIAVTAPMGMSKGVLTLLTMTDGARYRLWEILKSGEPLCFLTPKDEGVGKQYLVVESVDEQRIITYAREQARRWVLAVAEIGWPAGGTEQIDFQTWGELATSGETWGDLPVDYDTWADVPGVTPVLPGGPEASRALTPARFGW
jgi:hypothetical protein